MSDEQLMDLLMADKYGSVERGYLLEDFQVEAMDTPMYLQEGEIDDEYLAQVLQDGQGSLTASQPGGGFALLAELMFNPVLLERVNQALLNKEKGGGYTS